jgi:A/G-specific adenine glycosylase
MNLKALLTWSKTEFPELPWRKNRSLYRTLVSEIMLQQTTVGTVRNHYERFLVKFPTLESLANASEDELIVAWKGLGYYRRARSLKKIAEAIATDHGGKFPSDIESLMEIPGIGPYTANALVGIGMDKRSLAVDANLERVIARLFNIGAEKGLKLQKEIQARFVDKKIFTEKVSFRELNEALMDLGRTYCQARKASCELCPLKIDCASFKLGTPLKLPLMKEETKKTVDHEIHLLRVFVMKQDKILVYQKASNEWLSGQFEVPTFILSTTDEKLKQYPKLKMDQAHKPAFSFVTGITKYKIKNSVLILSEKEFKNMPFSVKSEWRSIADEDSNLSTATLKAMAKLPKSPAKTK